MQLAHFAFGIGAFISPFIVEPFLREISDTELGHSPVASSPNSTSSDVVSIPLNIDPSTLRIKWAFFIIGGASLLIWLTFVLTYLKKPGNKQHETREGIGKPKKPKNNAESVVTLEIVKPKSDEKDPNADPKILQPVFEVTDDRTYRGYHKFIIVLLAALFIHLAYGLELSFGVMLASYARLSELALSKSRASFVTS